MASSVDCNYSERILSTPAIFKETFKLFGPQGCSDDKNCSYHLLTSSVIYIVLLNRRTATWNLFVKRRTLKAQKAIINIMLLVMDMSYPFLKRHDFCFFFHAITSFQATCIIFYSVHVEPLLTQLTYTCTYLSV